MNSPAIHNSNRVISPFPFFILSYFIVRAADNTAISMETSAAAAQCHYQAGRIGDSLIELEQCDTLWDKSHHKIITQDVHKTDDNNDEDDNIIMADDDIKPIIPNKISGTNSTTRIELIALPPLARRADIAMCRFRSAISSTSGVGNVADTVYDKDHEGSSSRKHDDGISQHTKLEKSLFNLWMNALETNTNYRQALKGAATSLVHTCNVELQSNKTSHTNNNNNSNHTTIQKAMKSTSMATLMAGIAASHLYLYHTEDTTQNKTTHSSENTWSALVDAAISTANLMRTRNDWMNKLNNSNDTGTALDVSNGVVKLSKLEESICILNETLCSINDERGNIAMHSFISALKVAALATGKLILPNESTTKKVTSSSKRQRTEKEDVNDAWNGKYLHTNPLLHSLDRFVDALSFHTAALRYPQSKGLFINKREVCFDEALSWENQSGALYDTNTDSNQQVGDMDNGCAGYVWKVQHCLHGLERLSNHLHGTCDTDGQKMKASLHALELLTSSSSSQFACNLLGCIYAQQGDYSRAIEKFQLSLDYGEKGRTSSDEEIGTGLVQRRTLLNTAICFLSMGEADAPLELLLHLWQSVEHQHASVEVPVPMALLLSSSSHEMEMLSAQPESNQIMKNQLLWKLFNASSIAQDWSTCLSSTEGLMQRKDYNQQHHSIASVFALLQCRRSGAAQDTTRTLIPKLSNQEQHRRVVAELYHADALLLNNQNTNDDNIFDEEVDPFDCTHRATSALQNCAQNNSSNESLRELQVTVYNDHGIALLMKDDSVGALHCFREAAKLVPPSSPLSWLTLPTYFNLSLLLLRDGYAEESAKTWLNARGWYFKIWQAAMKGDTESLRELKNLRVVAINRHGLLMAKRSMQGEMWQQENVMEWVPPAAECNEVNEDSTRLGGIDTSQVTALDVVLLKYACTSAERKSSSSFRMNVGNMY